MKLRTLGSLLLALAALTDSSAHAACPIVPPAGCKLVTASTKLPAEIDQCYYVEGATGSPHTYEYLNVVDGGSLLFVEKPGETTDFRVSSVLVEKGGLVQAGTPDCAYGSQGGRLEIGLWGDDPTDQGTKQPPGVGISCLTNPAAAPGLRCFPAKNSDGTQRDYGMPHYCTVKNSDDPCASTTPPATEPKNALLEPYGKLNFDTNSFGYKTFAVAYGGSLRLYGFKGAKPLQDARWAQQFDSNGSCVVPQETQSQLDPAEMKAWANLTGSSWARLEDQQDDTSAGQTTLTLDRRVTDWKEGDQIVVGTTDWHPSHSELREIRQVLLSASGTKVVVDLLEYPHFARIFDAADAGDFTNEPNRRAVDTRAVVGLLTRSIRIYSRGDKAGEKFPETMQCTIDKTKPDCYFGGHVIVRQGFKDVQLEGVEFKQLGQGGRIGHYPVHFHLAKTTAYTPGTFVKDSSVWDSMTRFVVLHGTHDVNLSRNVGYLSLGHGYYIEDASEIRNRLCHNLGVSARAGLQQYVAEQANMEHWHGGEPPRAARLVPPILDGTIQTPSEGAASSPTGSDTYMPVMYWMMNAYNEFVGNAAVGVHGFGSCFWLLGSAVSGPSQTHQFDGFAGYNSVGYQAPLLRFRGNTCFTSPLALPATREIKPGGSMAEALQTGYKPIANPYLNNGAVDLSKGAYDRPIVNGSFRPMLDGKTKACSAQYPSEAILNNNTEACVMTILDRFATSFNWAEINFGSIWLRPWFYLFSNGAVTDQLFGGLGFVTGGDWQQALPGYLALAQNSLFVGTTQPTQGNRYAKRSGPDFTVKSGADLSNPGFCKLGESTCNLYADGTGFYHGAFQPKRLITIYDGPTYADGNAFMNIGAWDCTVQPCAGKTKVEECTGAQNGELTLECGIYTSTTQPQLPDSAHEPNPLRKIVVVDAAIGWKQPNGFYYPPAFNYRRNAFPLALDDDLNKCFTPAPGDYTKATFKPGSCRHNVVDRTSTYLIGNMFDLKAATPTVQSGPKNQIDSGTIDFATILLDLDGSLTGSTSKIDGRTPPGLTTSVSENRFFDAPAQSPECLSHGLQTSPYTFLTTSVGRLVNPPSSGTNAIATSGGSWSPTPAVAIYRQWKLASDEEQCGPVCDGANYGCKRASFMGMASVYQSPFLTMTEPPGLPRAQTGALYYLDTDSGSQSVSCVKGSASLSPAKFTGDESYVVYNIFPQRDSATRYQIYVGNVADDDLSAIDFRYVRVNFRVVDAASRTKVSDPCDPRNSSGWCSAAGTLPTLKNGILTVRLDHKRLLTDAAFSIASRAKYEQCMPRDLCYFDAAGNQCRSCLTNPSGPGCLRKGDFLPADVKSMNRPDAAHLKPLDTACEQWATLVSGELKVGGGNVTSADCPSGGCVGFAFRLPNGFKPKPYQAVENSLHLSRCFLASAWMNDVLVQRKNGSVPADPQCGAPEMLSPEQEFCTDSMLDLPAEKDGDLTSAAPARDGANDPELMVAGGQPVRSVVGFDPAAIDSFVAGGGFTRATLEMTVVGTSGAGEQLVDAHPLLQDFADPDEDASIASATAEPASVRNAATATRVAIGRGGRRVPVRPLRGFGGGPPVVEPPGVTWTCAVDLVPSDDQNQCAPAWATPGGDYGVATASPAEVDGPPGTVIAWDVTADVEAGVSGWLLRDRDESIPSGAAFYSTEGAQAEGDPALVPRLVLE